MAFEWTPERNKYLKTLIEGGIGPADVAAAVGQSYKISPNIVSQQLIKLGLQTAKPTTSQSPPQAKISQAPPKASPQQPPKSSYPPGTNIWKIIADQLHVKEEDLRKVFRENIPKAAVRQLKEPKEPKQPRGPIRYRKKHSSLTKTITRSLLSNFGMVGGYIADRLTADDEEDYGGTPGYSEADMKAMKDLANKTLDSQKSFADAVGKGLEGISFKLSAMAERMVSALAQIGAAQGVATPKTISLRGAGTEAPPTKTAFGGILGGSLGLGAMKSSLTKVALVSGGAIALGGLMGGLPSFFGNTGIQGTTTPPGTSEKEEEKQKVDESITKAQEEERKKHGSESSDVSTIKTQELEFKTDGAIKFQANTISFDGAIQGIGENNNNKNQPQNSQGAAGATAAPGAASGESGRGAPPDTQPTDMSGGQDFANYAAAGGAGGAGVSPGPETPSGPSAPGAAPTQSPMGPSPVQSAAAQLAPTPFLSGPRAGAGGASPLPPGIVQKTEDLRGGEWHDPIPPQANQSLFGPNPLASKSAPGGGTFATIPRGGGFLDKVWSGIKSAGSAVGSTIGNWWNNLMGGSKSAPGGGTFANFPVQNPGGGTFANFPVQAQATQSTMPNMGVALGGGAVAPRSNAEWGGPPITPKPTTDLPNETADQIMQRDLDIQQSVAPGWPKYTGAQQPSTIEGQAPTIIEPYLNPSTHPDIQAGNYNGTSLMPPAPAISPADYFNQADISNYAQDTSTASAMKKGTSTSPGKKSGPAATSPKRSPPSTTPGSSDDLLFGGVPIPGIHYNSINSPL